MNAETVIIQKNKLTYVIRPDDVTVYVGFNQWISYNQYNNFNRKGITEFRQTILKSKKDEYDSASDQMSLAYSCNIKGVGTIKPREIELWQIKN